MFNRRKPSSQQFHSLFADSFGIKSFSAFDEYRLSSMSTSERAELYSASAMVYAATNFRALNIAQIPLKVVSNKNNEVVTDGILPYIFSRQNGMVEKMRRAEVSYCTFGYTLFHKQRNAMTMPVDIAWLNPTGYMVDADNYCGLRGFRVNGGYHEDTGAYISPQDAVYLNGIDLFDDFDGVAPVEAAFAAASAEKEVAQTFYAVFRNTAIPAAFVQPTADYALKMTQENAEGLQRIFRTIVQGVRNAGRTIISPHRVEITTLQPPFRDMDTRHITDQMREQIAIAFGIPIELLFPSASNYAQFEGARRTWAHTWLVPHIQWYCDGFTQQLAQDFGDFRVEPDLDAVPFLKEDVSSRINTITAKLREGLITYGAAQTALGLPVIPETENYVYSAVLNAPVPIAQASTLWQTLNGAFAPEDTPALDDDAPRFADRPDLSDLETPIASRSWIPDEQYKELAAWKKKATKERTCDFAPMHLRQDVVDFVEKAIDETDDALDLIFANAKAWLSLKSIQSTRLDFESDFEDILAEARNGGLNRRRFGTLLRNIIAKYGRRAYRDGLMDGGIEDGELDNDDYQAVNALIAQQSQYVTNFADTLFKDGISDEMAIGKPEMWFNKSLMPMYQAGLASADKNGLYEWTLGRTEVHCETCLALNGQKHRMKEYVKRGLIPQSDKLACKGFNCDCKLVKTTGRAKGKFPSIATKHRHLHDPDNLLQDKPHV